MPDDKKNPRITERVKKRMLIIESEVEQEWTPVKFKKEVRKILPEGVSESEIQRMIPQSDEINYVGDLREWWISQGYRPCAHVRCTNALPRDARQDKKYCSDRCRNAERQRRFRENNPEKVYEIQRKHWSDK